MMRAIAAIPAAPAPTLAAALALPEIAALVDAAENARIILATHEPYPMPVLYRMLAALSALKVTP
jgi:hypothetical protein